MYGSQEIECHTGCVNCITEPCLITGSPLLCSKNMLIVLFKWSLKHLDARAAVLGLLILLGIHDILHGQLKYFPTHQM